MKINKKLYFTFLIIGIIGLYFVTYYFISESMLNKLGKSNSVETLYNNGSKVLNENFKVYFYTEDKKDKVTTIGDLKKEFNLENEITEDFLIEKLSAKGYKLSSKSNEDFIFKKEKENLFKKNTYYIGEKDGYLAIYKTDDKGKMTLSKVYSDEVSIDMLRDSDAEKIKSYEYFNSNNFEEAENKILELTT